MPYVALKNSDKCQNCGFCDEYVACSSKHVCYPEECIGCCACYISCPNKAIEIRERTIEKKVQVEINEKRFSLPERITIKHALEIAGFKVSKFPSESGMFAPCEVGGCFNCAVEVDGTIRPSCITGIRDGMNIKTSIPENYIPRRIVHGWMGHSVGGVGTPWWLKGNGAIEVACFTAGCNLRCPQCQNWTTTYCGKGEPLAPKDAAIRITEARKRYRVNRMAISGGESTLNRLWLLQYLKESKKLNPDREARLHVDTNATILTMDYIDELIEAGMTDIGPDLKGLYPETFMRITGIENKELVERYQKTAWEATEYIINKYKDKVFIGIGIPYNASLISIQEIAEMGGKIVKIDPTVQVSVLDYRSEFRARNITRPSLSEMVLVWKALKETGLKIVLCQTGVGYIGPEIDNVP